MVEENDGRGVVLLGHSQGAGHLRRLLAEELDDDARLRSLLVSAVLLGTSVAVPEGELVGGDLQEIPACTGFRRRSSRGASSATATATSASRWPGPDDPRSVAGLVRQGLGPTWGLHLLDANLAQDVLIDLVSRQAEARAGG